MSNYEIPHANSEAPTGSGINSNLHQSASTHTLHNLFRVVTKRRKWIIASILVSVILVVIVTIMMRPAYEATATIELNKSNAGSMDLGLGDEVSQQLTSGGDSLLTDLQTETAILQGDSLALAVIKQLDLPSKPEFAVKGPKIGSEEKLPLEESPRTRSRLLRIFASHLRVQPVRGTRLILVSYVSHDPKLAAEVANALIESYKRQYLQSHYDATTEASDWLTKQLSELKGNVQDSEKKLTDFEKQTGILSFSMMPTGSGNDSAGGGGGEIHSVVIQKLDALNAELTVAEANRIEKEAIFRLAQTGSEDVILGLGNDPLASQSNSMVLTQGGGLSNLQVLRQQQSQLKVNVADASTTFGANNRHLKELQTQIHAMDEQIHQEMQQIIKRAQTDFELARQTENEIRRRFDSQQVAASKLNEQTVEFAVLSEEAYSRKKLYEDLYTKLQEANVSAGIKATNITIVDPARSQSDPIRPRPAYNLALGLLFGMFVGLASAFAVDTLDRTVTTSREVEEITGKPVIGIIPILGESGKSYGYVYGSDRRKKAKAVEEDVASPGHIWMLSQPDSSAAEAFRALRTSIMLSRAGRGPKIILITSCIPGEGKTTVSTNLAVAYAQHNKRVIIIEADMRRPRMKHVMDVSNAAGLSGVLTGVTKCEDAIIRGVHVPTLDVLPAGPRPPMPSEILGSSAFDEMLEELKPSYDIILIDSPPALLVTDAVLISTKADAVLWVSHAGVVTRPYLARAAEMIERNRMPVIGFVLNRIQRTTVGYGYEYYGSYYGEKDKKDDV